MSTKTRILILFLLLSIQSFSQINVEKMMTKRFLSCDDILVNNAELLPVYYRQKSMDTVGALIDFWKKECGQNPVINTFSNLMAIQNKSDLNVDSDALLLQLNSYLEAKSYFDDDFSRLLEHKNFYGESRLYLKYAKLFDFIKLWATDLLKKSDLTKKQEFVLNVYGGNIKSLERLKTPPYNTTNLADSYNKLSKNLNTRSYNISSYYSVYPGLWMPTGKLKRLGNHPVLGLRYGFSFDKSFFDFDMHFSFLKSKHKYLSMNYDTDTLEETDYFSEFYFGGHYGYKLMEKKQHFWYITTGAGLDILKTIKPVENNKDKPLNSFNFNIGTVYTYQFKNTDNISFEVNYNFVNFKNKGGSDLSGNYISLNLIYSFKASMHRRF